MPGGLRALALAVLLVTASGSVVASWVGEAIGGGGPDGLPALESNLAVPSAVVIGPDGMPWIAARESGQILRLTPSGTIEIVFQGEVVDSVGGVIDDPWDLAFGPNGELAVGERVVTLLLPELSAAPRVVHGGSAVDFGPAGELYLVDFQRTQISRFDPQSGSLEPFAGCPGSIPFCHGSAEGSPALDYRLTSIADIATDAGGNLYIAVPADRILRVDASDQTIRTVIGNGQPGFAGDDGPAASALVDDPTDIAIAPNGDLYFVDSRNFRIRRIDAATGTVTTVAGNGVNGYAGDGGPAIDASFPAISGLAVNAEHDLFVTANLRLRKIDAATGIIDTVAGNGTIFFSGDGYPAHRASISGGATGVDADGNVFVADTFNHRVRRIDASTGIITTYAGTGASTTGIDDDGLQATQVVLPSPVGLSFDAEQNLYVRVDGGVRRIDRDTGIVTTMPAGSLGVVDDLGRDYRVDLASIYRIDPATGTQEHVAGNGTICGVTTGGPASQTSVTAPRSIRFDAAGNIYFVELRLFCDNLQSSSVVRRISHDLQRLDTLTGGVLPSFDHPLNLTFGPAIGVPSLAHAIAVEPGGAVWFTSWAFTARLDPRTGLLERVLGPGGPYAISELLSRPESDLDSLDAEGLSIGPDRSLFLVSAKRVYRVTEGGSPPVAVAAAPASALCAGAHGATVTLDGSSSHDPDDLDSASDSIANHWWYEDYGTPNERLIGKGAVAEAELSIGSHPITLLVRDVRGNEATDEIEIVVTGTGDADGDLIDDCADNCSMMANPTQLDSDANRVGDACDSCWSLGETDGDGDGVCTALDNCPEVANSGQADRDGDGFGDSCDVCPVTFNDEPSASVRCVTAREPVGDCRRVVADVNRPGSIGRVILTGFDRSVPDKIEFHWRGVCSPRTFELLLNGTLLDSWFSYTACSPAFTYSDPALIQSAWRTDGENELRLRTIDGPTRVVRAYATVTAGQRSQTACFVDATGSDCLIPLESGSLRTVGFSDATVLFSNRFAAVSSVVEQPYGPDPLSVSFDLDTSFDGHRLCVSSTVPDAPPLLGISTTGELYEVNPLTAELDRRGFLPIVPVDADYDVATGQAFAASGAEFGVRFDVRDGSKIGQVLNTPFGYENVEFAFGDLIATYDFYWPQEGYAHRSDLLDLDNQTIGDTPVTFPDQRNPLTGFTHDESSGIFWGVIRDIVQNFDPLTGASRTLGYYPSRQFSGIELGPDGFLYLVSEPYSNEPPRLFRVGRDDPRLVAVGDLDLPPTWTLARLTTGGRPGSVDCIDVDSQGETRLAINDTCGPPTARIAPVAPVECVSAAGAAVTLDGSSSTDPNSTPGTQDALVSYEWYLDRGGPQELYLGSGAVLTTTLPFGLHQVTLVVGNAYDERSTATIPVEVVDTQLPTLGLGLTPATLWPPNHDMVEIEATPDASDNCGPPAVRLVSIGSSEPDDAPGGGDGTTTNDMRNAEIGVADTGFALRAERAGDGVGRVYEVTYEAEDRGGLKVTATRRVLVPHSLGGATEPLLIRLHSEASGTTIEWDDVGGAVYYNVVRGDLAAPSLLDSVVQLGSVDCIASGLVANSTAGYEDAGTPQPNAVFYYLAEYHDGWRASGYGSESVAGPRSLSVGDCD
ncbi:MAG TPA: thrombospondin type 3 repeat-containing protein [Candidatus Polarisedimenticolaceae bacterium]|nr:thrombospondin type 3 repeat-containing protein [Candidatus Polarisedimenticolaceae bacterium]